MKILSELGNYWDYLGRTCDEWATGHPYWNMLFAVPFLIIALELSIVLLTKESDWVMTLPKRWERPAWCAVEIQTVLAVCAYVTIVMFLIGSACSSRSFGIISITLLSAFAGTTVGFFLAKTAKKLLRIR